MIKHIFNTDKYPDFQAYHFSDLIYNQTIICTLNSSNGGYTGYFQKKPSLLASGISLEETKKNLRGVALQCGRKNIENQNLTEDQLLQNYLTFE